MDVNLIKRELFGRLRVGIADVTFSNKYPEGGEAIDPVSLGMTTIYLMLIENADGYIFKFDYANNKLMAFTPTVKDASDNLPAEEVVDETDLSGVTARIIAFGL